MKHSLQLIGAGITGGLIVLLGMQFLSREAAPPVPVAQYSGKLVNLSEPTAGLPANTPDLRLAAGKSMPAVVSINALAGRRTGKIDKEGLAPRRYYFGDEPGSPLERDYQRRGTGSGVIYSPDGYIVTNNHVVEFADKVEVTLSDNRKFNARIVGRDPNSDLAVLKIETNGLPTMEIGDSDAVEVGEWVLAVGNPFELESTVTAGIISARGRDLRLMDSNEAIETFLQTDAAVNPGNSGGALVNAQGALIGINTAIATRTGVFSGYSFAIPINLAKRVVDDLIAYGEFQRPILGVTVTELDSDYAEDLGVEIIRGVVIETLTDGGSAQYAGVLPKDIIIQVDDRPITNGPDLQEVIARSRVGDTVNLTVYRKGKRIAIPVVLQGEGGSKK